jgi:hypothetical protein
LKNPELSIKHKKTTWTCTCGAVILKKGEQLSGDPSYPKGYHIHCPQCNKIVAQHINPKEIQQEKNLNEIAIITIDIVPEAQETANSQIETEISKSLQCDWLLKTQKVTVLEKAQSVYSNEKVT